ncbi:MAG: M1 family aminopeptidase, partial [Bacteroidota bacterium]|nr:M1 family aminopeptidase [Bacteroidota bacterium]
MKALYFPSSVFRYVLLFVPFFSASQRTFIEIKKGVSEELAQYRKKVLDDVHYNLNFNIPAEKSKAIAASITISFNLKENLHSLPIDFKEERAAIKSVTVNGSETPIICREEHIVIDQKLLRKGVNAIKIYFTAGELSLNRNNDYLYTLLVPDRSRTVFPCFDQPNIKAHFQLSLSIPKQWKALSNSPLQDSVVEENTKVYRYKESDLFSTYLFSFATGRFEEATETVAGRTMHFYYRETDSIKIRLSVDTIFKQHATAINYLENYTGIPFPFQKLDFVAIPDFQYGGMEHVGAIDYKAASLFLDSGATKDQQNARSNLIAHETSHMWFGDLVTMQWFNDVWMKEVFANFMADKITQESGTNYELKFLLTHLPRAYAVDRTAGANPIRQQLSNLQEAGTLYGAIIYDKAPVMMRQLERLMGASAFRQGIKTYLRKYSFSNATWPDLITILDSLTPTDLQAWNKVWVNTPGRPQFSYVLRQTNGLIKKLAMSQKGEHRAGYFLPQVFEIALVYNDHIEEHTVIMKGREAVVKEVEGKK